MLRLDDLYMDEKEQADLKNVLENLPGYIYWKNVRSEYIGCNNNLARVSKLKSCDEIIGKKDEDFGWGEEQAKSFRADDSLVMETGETKITEHMLPIFQHNQLINIYVRTEKMPLRNKQGKIIGVLGVALDITELKKTQQSLKEEKEAAVIANKAKTEFLENMRHDVRTPMTGIIGCAKLIKSSKSNSFKVGEYSDILIESSEALLSFLAEILDSVRLNSGDVPLLKKKFNLESILEKIIKLNQAKACEKKLSLSLKHDNSIPKYVIGDPKRLYRIVLELVTNALKYTNEGYVTVSTKLAKKDHNNLVVKIVIEDTGIGIPLDKQQDIFVQFKRLTASFQGIYHGSGLGLALVKGFLKDLESEVYVTSEINKGSVFTCVIPLTEALLLEDFGSDHLDLDTCSAVIESTVFSKNLLNFEVISPSSSRRVLLVEDHNITAKINKDILISSSCQVDIASNGAMAISLINQNEYDLVFMDLGLPDMNGREVTQKIRAGIKNKFIPIIGLTAHASIEDKQRCLSVGMNTVLIKPLTKEKISDIFIMFIPKHDEFKTEGTDEFSPNDDGEKFLLVMTGCVIDLNLSLKLTGGNKDLVSESLNKLLIYFPEDLAELKMAYQSCDWQAINSILHKLRGLLSYYAVPRLRESCIRFHDYLNSGKKELLKNLYEQFLLEFKNLKRKVESDYPL